MDERIQAYIDRMNEIRKLSSVSIEGIDSADEYEQKLLENYKRIGELGAENRHLIKEVIEPIITSTGNLSEDDRRLIEEMKENLYDAKFAAALDLPMVALLHERSKSDASDDDDDEITIRRLGISIDLGYIMTANICRIVTALNLARQMQAIGLEAYEKIRGYLEHDRFMSLSTTQKKQVIINASYAPLLYNAEMCETREEKWKMHEKKCELLFEAEKLAYDDFYLNALPEYSWDLYKWGICYYFAYMGDEDVPPKYIHRVIEKIREGIRLQEEAPPKYREYYDALYSLDNMYASLYSKQVVAGEITFAEYKEKILKICKNPGKNESFGRNLDLANQGDIYNKYVARLIATKYMSCEDEEFVTRYYREFVRNTFRVDIDDDFANLVSTLFTMLLDFAEIPGGLEYEEMGLKLFAAIHPPTYIHSIMVAKLSECLAKHLIRLKPELFVGLFGRNDTTDVEQKGVEILEYTYHAALCHDFGKLGIMDTIYIYGRSLLDSEFGLLKEHPLLGAETLKRHVSTAKYADVANGHHRWYDDTKGYPEGFKTADSPVKIIIDIVTCADCMDAATDSVGRSYSSGKTFEQYEQEVAEGAGTRYAPYFPELFKEPLVREDLKWLLSEGRHKAYRNTFYLLRDMRK
ncbi:MAG: HD domain-containing protein [Lachnospiraceae bacterium]|nr:HD domain-containing protein [Lachnospiraceae bacterium]